MAKDSELDRLARKYLGGAAKKSPRTVAERKPRKEAVVQRLAEPQQAQQERPQTQRHPRLMQVPGFVWTTLEGTTVLAKHRDPVGNTNYVAYKNDKGTYSVVQLTPRRVVRVYLKLRDVPTVINGLIDRDIKRDEQDKDYKLKQEQKRAEDWRNFNNQFGFYIVPSGDGGVSDPDDKVYDAQGPYEIFEKAGYLDSNPDLEVWADHYGEDVEDEAQGVMKSAPPDAKISIVLAKNPREAIEGPGQVWWQDGVFLGPPVDPRQTALRFRR
jgi:hypothetical protein